MRKLSNTIALYGRWKNYPSNATINIFIAWRVSSPPVIRRFFSASPAIPGISWRRPNQFRAPMHIYESSCIRPPSIPAIHSSCQLNNWFVHKSLFFFLFYESQILGILIKFFWFPIKILSKSASIPITVRNFHESRIFKINRISLRFVSIQRRVASDINWIMELTKHGKATIDFPSRLEEVSLGDSSFRSWI